MLFRGAICAAALTVLMTPAYAFDDAMYPNLSGQWVRVNLHKTGQITFDQTKGWGREQEAPLTPEYKAIHEASLADQARGGQGNWYSGARCLPPGMPATMNGYNSLEFVVLPETTYVLVEHNLPIQRRIYTDGRDWSDAIEPSFQGYSIGRWIDSAHTGHFDALEVETRYFKGPRALDPTGIPVHADNQSIVRERIHLVGAILHDELTLIDHALTRPWSVDKIYERTADKYPAWREENCPGVTLLLKIRDELYFRGADGQLLPTRKDQPPPDLRYFRQQGP